MGLFDRTFNRVNTGISNFFRFVSGHRAGLAGSLLALLVAGAIAPLVGQQISLRESREEERDSAALIRKRADWFFHQRAYPLGHIPSGARLEAIQQMEEMQRTQGTLVDRFATQERAGILPQGAISSLSTTTWASIGPQPTSEQLFFNLTSGRVNAIAVDLCDTTGNTVYIAGAQGGVWKTTNANTVTGSGPTWTPLTDKQPSLAGGSLALDPVLSDCTGGHAGAIYFGTGEENFSFDSFYGAGVLTSHDGGATWSQDKTFMPTSAPQSATAAGPFIGSLSVQPGSSGATQVLLAGIQGVSAAVHSGVYRSTDGGNTWTKVLPASSSTFDFATGVAFDPGDSSGLTAYAVLGIPSSGSGEEVNNGLYKSIDGGNSWSRVAALDNAVNSALGNGASSAYGRMTIALGPSTPPNPANTEIVVAIADITATSCGRANSSCLLGTFSSTNGGTSFALVNSGAFCNAQCFYDISVGVDPANPKFIFLGGGANASGPGQALTGLSSVIFSNGGATFTDVSLDRASQFVVHVDNHAFGFAHPTSGANAGLTIVYIGDDGGVWSSSNVESNPGSQSWNNLNTNLSLTQFYPGNSIHPSNPQVAFAGAQDNGTQKFDPAFFTSPANPLETQNVESCGDGGWTAIDPSTPSTVYAACEDIGNLGTINKNQLDGEPGTPTSKNLAPNWLAIDTRAMDADVANFVPPLVLDSLTPSNLYFGTCRVWQSTSGGIAWSAISPALDGSGAANCAAPAAVVTTIAVSPVDSSTVYVGTDSGRIWATSTANMGTSAKFAEIDNSSTPGRTVTQVVGSPASNKIAYIGFSGFSSCSGCDGKGHIFKFDATTPPGSFTNITGNLPDVPVNDIVLDPADNTNNTIYVATDVGVFGTTNGGTVWSVLATGLPHIECTSLKLNNTARVILVGTHGRGDWELQLSGLAASALTGISPSSATAGASSFTLTLNGQGFPPTPTVKFGSTTGTVLAASATQITATIPASAVASSGEVPVSVTGAQNSLNFSVEAPLPVLNGNPPLSPQSVRSTANSVTITVSGSQFAANTGIIWDPTSGSRANNPSFLAPNPGGTATSFTVTVPASLLATALSRMVPPAPARRQGPDNLFWLLAAAFATVAGIIFFKFVPRKRRLIFGATLTAVVVLLFIAGCSNSGSGTPPPPGSVIVSVSAYSPGPGGGQSATSASFTVQ